MKITAYKTQDFICVKTITEGDIYGCGAKLETFFGDKYVYPTKNLCDNDESSNFRIYKHLKYVYGNGKYVKRNLNRRINNYVQRLF